jgi:hypothetical protein
LEITNAHTHSILNPLDFFLSTEASLASTGGVMSWAEMMARQQQQQQQQSFPLPLSRGAVMSQNTMIMMPPEQLRYLQEMRRGEQDMMGASSAPLAAHGAPQLFGGRMPYQEFDAPSRNMLEASRDRGATNAPFQPQDRFDPRSSLVATRARPSTHEDDTDMLRSMLLRRQQQEHERIISMSASAPFIPQDQFDPRALLARAPFQGMMNTQRCANEGDMDMLRSMLRQQEREGILLRQQQERIINMQRRPGDSALPPTKRRHIDAPMEQWSQENFAFQEDRLAHSEAQICAMPKPPKVRKRHVKSFPVKLMEAITDYYDETIVAWLLDGKSFVVVDPQEFIDKVLAQAFKGGKYASFVRKLNRWGFSRLISGTGMDCFHHPFFQRSRMDLCALITSQDSNSAESNHINSALIQHLEKPSLNGIEKYFEYYANNKEVAKEAKGNLKDDEDQKYDEEK